MLRLAVLLGANYAAAQEQASLFCGDTPAVVAASPSPAPPPAAALIPLDNNVTATLRIRIDNATYSPALLNIGDIGLFRDSTPNGCTNRIPQNEIVGCFSSTPYADDAMCASILVMSPTHHRSVGGRGRVAR